MKVALHISDTHFGTERPAVVEALLRLAREQQASAVILSGDITQRATRSQFEAASAFMDRLAISLRLILPGNHDIPLYALFTRFFMPYSRHQRVFGPVLEPVLETPDLLAVGVRTTRRYRHIEGEVSKRQIDQVAQRLQRASTAQLRIVVTHQPVFVTRDEDREHLLRGRDKAIRTWADAGADLILGGHIHRPFILGLHEHIADLSRAVWIVQAGTAMSTRTRHESNNSINLIRYGFRGEVRECTIERWDYNNEEQQFLLMENHKLKLSEP